MKIESNLDDESLYVTMFSREHQMLLTHANFNNQNKFKSKSLDDLLGESRDEENPYQTLDELKLGCNMYFSEEHEKNCGSGLNKKCCEEYRPSINLNKGSHEITQEITKCRRNFSTKRIDFDRQIKVKVKEDVSDIPPDRVNKNVFERTDLFNKPQEVAYSEPTKKGIRRKVHSSYSDINISTQQRPKIRPRAFTTQIKAKVIQKISKIPLDRENKNTGETSNLLEKPDRMVRDDNHEAIERDIKTDDIKNKQYDKTIEDSSNIDISISTEHEPKVRPRPCVPQIEVNVSQDKCKNPPEKEKKTIDEKNSLCKTLDEALYDKNYENTGTSIKTNKINQKQYTAGNIDFSYSDLNISTCQRPQFRPRAFAINHMQKEKLRMSIKLNSRKKTESEV